MLPLDLPRVAGSPSPAVWGCHASLDSSMQRARLHPCRVASCPRRDPVLEVADTASRERGNRPLARPSALWFCPPVRPWMPDRFWKNVLGISLDGEPSPSKGKERTVALGQLLPLQGQEPLRPDRALRCEWFGRELIFSTCFLGAKTFSRSGPYKAQEAIR